MPSGICKHHAVPTYPQYQLDSSAVVHGVSGLLERIRSCHLCRGWTQPCFVEWRLVLILNIQLVHPRTRQIS